MTAFAMTYIGEPDIPAGLTISEYRRSRPRRSSWLRRILFGREL
jgi:hypothetical protein